MQGRKPGLDTIKRRLASRPHDGPPPECPGWLDADAKTEWARIVPLIADVLRPADSVMLAAYCQAYSQWQAAERRVREDGLMIEGARGCMVLHPCARLSTSLLAELRRCAGEFGFTPSSRAKVDAPARNDDEQDDFNAFVGSQ